jgi:23S rRNA (cytosine1962-C5)-methyltransferase
MFNDAGFAGRFQLTAVNSINWARLMAQVVYYFYAAVRLGAPERRSPSRSRPAISATCSPAMSRPKMGLPVEADRRDQRQRHPPPRAFDGRLFGGHGDAHRRTVDGHPGQLELRAAAARPRGRAGGRSDARVRGERAMRLTNAQREGAALFASDRIEPDEMNEAMRWAHAEAGQVIDPHSAIGLAAARRAELPVETPVVTLATAHPAKFRDAVERATGARPPCPRGSATCSSARSATIRCPGIRGDHRLYCRHAPAGACFRMKLSHPDRRALGRLRADRQRPWPQARALRANIASSAPSRRRCGRPPPPIGTRMANSSPIGRRRRRPLGIPQTGAARGLAARLERSAFTAQTTPFRHLGFFPDMAPVWDWMRDADRRQARAECMNLFGYTGVGTLALAAKGARMTHVDASKKSVAEGKANAALSGMEDKPIRWMIDDAAKFVAREVRRGRRYDGIILDPPKWGRGPTGEVWKLEEGLPGLIADAARLLDAESRFLFLTVYAVRMSHWRSASCSARSSRDLGGKIDCGELCVREEARGLMLPTAIFARWSR